MASSYPSKLWILTSIFLTATTVLCIETVSIGTLLPKSQHGCVQTCLSFKDSLITVSDLGSALKCGDPYDNKCYCNTASSSAVVASSHFMSCASSRCAAGDITADVASMHSIYGSYCMNAGFTQPGATDWYTPTTSVIRPGQTADSETAKTTTQVTVVTQTVASTPNGASSTQPQVVTVHTTSTLLVNFNGLPINPISSSKSGSNKTTLGLGLGLGIPLALLIAGFGIWLLLRWRRKSARSHLPSIVPVIAEPGIEVRSIPYIPRKAVSMQDPATSPEVQIQTRELPGAGDGDGSGAPISISPQSAASIIIQHEVSGEGPPTRELSGQSIIPAPGHSTGAGATGHTGGEQRWELG